MVFWAGSSRIEVEVSSVQSGLNQNKIADKTTVSKNFALPIPGVGDDFRNEQVLESRASLGSYSNIQYTLGIANV